MNKHHIADKGLARNFKSNYMALTRAEPEGNFGYWCYFDENLFCQEREGCDNCMVRWRRHK
jgi:hypothetical protein